MIGHRLDVRTDDGVMDCYTFQPTSRDQVPAVIVYMDAFGIRPQLAEMAQRLALGGYFVILPDLYYRTGAFPPFDALAVAKGGAEHERFKRMITSISHAHVMRDTTAVLAYLDTNAAVRTGTVGVVGYCMGGGFALTAAGTFPDRVGAVASFHGGSLATDKPDSPHLLAGRIRARVYVGVAGTDPSFPKEQQDRLEAAFVQGGVDYTLETYEGAKHGFAVTGHLAYDRHASERHWSTLLQLFREAL